MNSAALYLFVYDDGANNQGKQMNNGSKIWADGNEGPATLIDGDKSTDCLTLGGAVIARDHLPEPRKSAATIKVGSRVYTAAEIDRLHQAK
jgi:hypothetical protein